MKIKLFKIRVLVAILSPLYISICAAVLLDLKSNIKWDCSSILYFLGLFFLIIACYISNELFRRSSNYNTIYDIRINEYVKGTTKEKPKRENIYDKCESNTKPFKRYIQYCSAPVLGILGLFFVIFSYSYSDNQFKEFENQNTILQRQMDSLTIFKDEQALQILELQQVNDSILKSINQQLNPNIQKPKNDKSGK